MVWIKTVDEQDATGVVKEVYEHSVRRVGTSSLADVVKVFSLKPAVLKAAEDFRTAIKDGASGLGRAREEMIAVVVSAQVHCTF
jgi:hypothetical protein